MRVVIKKKSQIIKENIIKRIPLHIRIKIMIVLAIISVIAIISTYLYCDYIVSKDLVLISSYDNQFITSYKDRFEILDQKVEDKLQTGIPSVDNTDTPVGNEILITPGKGDFVNLKGYKVNNKSYTNYNNTSMGVQYDTGRIAYSELFHKNSVLYETSGIVKLYDKYIPAAIGTYWANKYGLKNSGGATYKITMDNGKEYYIIIMDVKNPGDSKSRNDPSGKYSIGHYKGDGTICLTEFYRITFNANYPIGTIHRKMDYPNLVKEIKDDSKDVGISITMGNFNFHKQYEGTIKSFQLVEDPKVKDLYEQMRKEVDSYFGN